MKKLPIFLLCLVLLGSGCVDMEEIVAKEKSDTLNLCDKKEEDLDFKVCGFNITDRILELEKQNKMLLDYLGLVEEKKPDQKIQIFDLEIGDELSIEQDENGDTFITFSNDEEFLVDDNRQISFSDDWNLEWEELGCETVITIWEGHDRCIYSEEEWKTLEQQNTKCLELNQSL